MSERYKRQVEDPIEQGFSLRVTHRDPKTGLTVKRDPYILRVCGGENGKTRLWERPAGSGNLFDKHGKPIGRWEYEEKKLASGLTSRVGKYVPGAPHVEWTPPLTEDQKIAQENAALRAELAALKAEKERKDGQSKPARKE